MRKLPAGGTGNVDLVGLFLSILVAQRARGIRQRNAEVYVVHTLQRYRKVYRETRGRVVGIPVIV